MRPKVKDQYRDFIYSKVLFLEELHITLMELTHRLTGARVVYLATDDPENLFCLSFQTLPSNSTGVAHILEHTVLCGSKKFPVKDPFFSMTHRSLNTFMNALTGADFTCYVASSQLEKDFYNLLEVYLDAVFYPNLKELSFLQEGHRLELDPDLVYKGIVYNEMKGSLSNPETRLWNEITKYLTPDLTYAFNSGGDVTKIPELTWKELKDFHATYYHPSRCIFFFYGNLPIEKHLDFITENALKDTKKISPLSKIPTQKRFSSPVTKEGHFPGKNMQQFISFSWLTCSIKNQEEILALALIDSILMETDASPLKNALLKSGLCTQANGYLDTEMSEIPYVIICYGCKGGSTKDLKKILFETLKNFKVTEKQIEAAFHQLEFSRLEITGEYGPFGLTLFMRSVLAMQHGCVLEDALTVYSQLKKLRSLIKDRNYLTGLIRKYFLENSHFLTHTFKVDIELEKKEKEEEKARLKAIEKTLLEKDRSAIQQQMNALKEYQERTESQSIECLPKIELKDVSKDCIDLHLKREQVDQLTVFHHECFTNHIVYAHLIFDLPKIEYQDLPYLNLLFSILPEIGVKNRNYQENLEFINLYLGDFGAFLNIHPHFDDPSILKPIFGFKGKVLNRNLAKLFELLQDVCESPNLKDQKRVKELILQIHTSMENSLNRNALTYAIQKSTCPFSQSSYIGDALSGLTYFQFIRELAKDIDKRLPLLIEKFLQLKTELFHFTHPYLILSCDEAQYQLLSKEKFFGISSLPFKQCKDWERYVIPGSVHSQGYVISSPVAYSSFGIKAIAHSPSLLISTDLMEHTFLHKKVREQGGAYGRGINYNTMTGSFYFYAYRDPHILSTTQAFKESIDYILKGSFTEKELTEAKLGILQDLDSPVSPGARAFIAYSYFREGQTKKLRQEFRDAILSTTKKEVCTSVKTHLDPDAGFMVTFASQELFKQEGVDLQSLSIV